MDVNLTSSAFDDGGLIPRRFTCDGDNMPPPLSWSAGPLRTRGYALLFENPDDRDGGFTHWVLYDISPRANQWPNDYGGRTLTNGFGRSGYGGPCPPAGTGPHRYVFSVHAVDVRYLLLDAECVEALRRALDTHTIAVGRLTGHYAR